MATQTSTLRPVFYQSNTKTIYVVEKYVKVTPFSLACCVEGTREPQPNVRRLPRLDGPRLQAPERQSGRVGSWPVGARQATRQGGRYGSRRRWRRAARESSPGPNSGSVVGQRRGPPATASLQRQPAVYRAAGPLRWQTTAAPLAAPRTGLAAAAAGAGRCVWLGYPRSARDM